MRKVFKNSMVAHVWAQQSQSDGRSGNGQFYFSGDTIYSYRRSFPIARFVKTVHGRNAVLFTTATYSNTTAHHKSMARSAIADDVRVFDVAVVTDEPHTHKVNVTAMVSDLRGYVAELAKPKKRWYAWSGDGVQASDTMDARIASIYDRVELIEEYATTFGLDFWELNRSFENPISVDGFAQQVRDGYAKFNDPKLVRARERSRVKRELKEASILARWHAHKEGVHPGLSEGELRQVPKWLRRQYDIPYLYQRGHAGTGSRVVDLYAPKPSVHDYATITPDEWRDGKNGRLPYHWDAPTYIRRKGDVLQTSRGAEVPWCHAKEAFVFAQAMRKLGKSWQRNGGTFEVGHFQLDSVDEFGNVKAGCHTIAWEEILRLALREVPHLVEPSYPLPVFMKTSSPAYAVARGLEQAMGADLAAWMKA